mgnify:CR=1 FL=1
MKNKWSLVIHDVGNDYVNIWVGTLFQNERKYESSIVRLLLNGQTEQEHTISKEDWEKPFSKLTQRFYKIVRFNNLKPGVQYDVNFLRNDHPVGEHVLEAKNLSTGTFRTLPDQLKADSKPFVVALGSCYYNESDGGQVADAYSALLNTGDESAKPDVKFLTGDQVYLDIGLDSLSPIESEIRNRIADDYANSWQSLREMLRNGGTWMLADDHEYWNNYPNTSGTNPYLWMITAFDDIKKIWKDSAEEGIKQVQQISAIRTFSIGRDVSFCFADVRCQRTDKVFLATNDFKRLTDWATNLTSPGVLSIAQPLMVKPGGSADKNLANYKQQYAELIIALASTGYDILVLSGDVHFGRIGSVPLGTKGATLHEVISSPMSNLTGIDGKIAANVAKKLKHFPAIDIDGMPKPSPKVTYPPEWRISTKQVKSWFLPTNHTKTKEHFFTLAFTKNTNGGIKVKVQAWKLRERDRKGLPRKQFRQANELILK